MSRGTIFGLSAGSRRGLVLLWSALLMCSLVLQYAVIAPATTLAANGLKAGTPAGFEIDGNLAAGDGASNPGGIPAASIGAAGLQNGDDWSNSLGSSGDDSYWFRDAVDGPNNIASDATPDTSAYGGGNKEADTRDWVYFNNSGPNGKTDYRHVMAHTRVANGNGYVFVGSERVVNNGDMVVDFELNRLPFKKYSDGVSKPNRSVGDVLISLEYSNGGSNPVVTVYEVATVTDYAAGQVVTFNAMSDADVSTATRSATNWQDLASVTFPGGSTYPVPAFDFAEASVNLSALNLNLDCLSFQQGSIRSRTGGSPSTSQLKDASEAFPLDLNTCGKLTIEKRDKVTNDLVPGATFLIEPDPTVGSNKASLTVKDGSADDPDGKADGKIVFSACEPGEYTVTETKAPDGYFLPGDVDAIDTILPGGSATFVFEDPLAAITWEKVGPDGELLGGATFTITPNPRTGTGSLEVADNTGQAGYSGADVDDSKGKFKVKRVLIGGPYTIAETTPPAGYIGSDKTVDVTISKDLESPYVVDAGTWTNTLGSIRWQKEDASGNLLDGATFRVTGPFGYDESVTDNSAPDADPADGTFLLEGMKTGEYTVTETAAPDGYILDSGPAKADVSAAKPDAVLPAKTFINHLGKITWLKYGPDGKTLLGGAEFTISPDPYSSAASLTVKDNDAHDADKTDGQFELGSIKTGTYEIVESKAPAGYVIDTTKLKAEVTQTLKSPYTVQAGSVTNTLGSISWVKNGPDGTSLLGGATFTITPDPTTGTGSLVVVDNGDNDADTTDGEFKVVNVLVDSNAPHYEIAETAAPAGYVGDASKAIVNPTTGSPNVSVAAGTWINTLGSLAWEKREGSGSLLGGATFQVTGPFDYSETVLDNSAPDADPADGKFLLQGLKLGDYSVTETQAPDGYVLDATPRPATLTAGKADVEITDDFVNTLGTLAWTKNDAHGKALDGATFHVTGPFGFDLTVMDNDTSDADGDAGQFLLTDLKLGEYTVTETVAPAGYILDPNPQSAELTQDAPSGAIETPFVNTLGELNWTKDKDDQDMTPLGGATFEVKPNPYGGASLTVKDNDSNDKDTAAGSVKLADVPVGAYTITEIEAPSGYAKSDATCTITVSAENPTGTPACRFGNPPIPPEITIVKTAGTSQAAQAPDGDTLSVEAVDNNVVYKYVVTNPKGEQGLLAGDVDLVDVTVTDDNGTPDNTADDFQPQCYAGDTALTQPFDLAAGDSVTCYTLSTINIATTNVAVAAGKSVGEGTPVKDDDDAKVVIIGPAISLIKTSGGSEAAQVADGGTYATEAFANNVTYVYEVTNGGTTALQNIALTDDKLGAITCPATTLAVGAQMTCVVTTTVSVDTENTAVVNATSPAGKAVDATDKANVEILVPSISVVKTAGSAGDGAILYTNGGDVTYTYVVTNTGDVALSDIALVDNKLGAVSCDATTLAIGASMTCFKTGAVNVDTTNIATVQGETPHATVSDSDDAVVMVRNVGIEKTNDATSKKAPGDAVGYTLKLTVVNGPIPAMTVVDTLPANFGTPSGISDGGVYDAGARTITWNLANVASGKTLTYTVTIAATTQGGTYTNVAEITTGPCTTACKDDSTVPVWRVSILKDNNATAPLIEGDNVVYTLTFAVQNGPITSMTVTDTLPVQVVTPRNFSLAPASIVGQVITWNLTNVADGAKITYTATIADGTVEGSYTNTAVITRGPCVAEGCRDDSTVTVVVPEPEVTPTPTPKPTPKVTPPPTSTIDGENGGSAGTGLLLVLAAIAGLMLAAGYLVPARATARKRNRRG